MNKLLAVLLVVLLIVSGAGCASKGDDAESSGDVEDQADDSSGDDRTVEDSDSDRATDARQTQEVEFKRVEPKDVDEIITDMEVYDTDDDLVVEKLILVDKRDYEESTNWQIEALVKNNAEEPIYLVAYFGDKDKELPTYIDFKTLYSGESYWLKGLPIDKNIYSLDELPALCIVAHTTIMPETSPEFTNFKNINLFSSADYGRCPFVDVESVDLVVKDEEKGWTSAIAKVSSEEGAKARIVFTGLGITEEVTIPAGKTIEVEAPIRGNYGPDGLSGIKINIY